MMKRRKNLFKVSFLLVVILVTSFFILFNVYKLNPIDIEELELAPGSFVVVALPDTQFYSEDNKKIFCKQVDWVIKNKDKLNIVFVSHLGDIVNDGANMMYEWDNANQCLSKFDGVIPYSVLPGNHDSDVPNQKSSGFSVYTKYFGEDRFKGYSWYRGSYKNNQNSYQILNINNLSFLFLNLEIEPDDDVIDWAKSIIKENNDRYVILTTHKFLPVHTSSRDNTLAFSLNGNTGEEIWQKLVFNNCSIKQVWNGHFHGENSLVSKNICGQPVYQFLSDYQSRRNGGDGWLRLYVFNPLLKKIDVYTYSPILKKIEVDLDSRFSLELII